MYVIIPRESLLYESLTLRDYSAGTRRWNNVENELELCRYIVPNLT